MQVANSSSYCEDCGRYNDNLYLEDGCADGECCEKRICRDGCIFTCPNNHRNRVITDGGDGDPYQITCQVCNIV